jgi:antiviral helicase SLH1
VRGNVVALGTQYINVFQHSGSEKIEVKPYEVQEVSQMQSKAARQGRSSRFWLFCPSEAQATYMRLLDDGLPLASRLHESETFRDWLKVQRSTPNSGIVSKQDAIDLLSNTFLSKDIRNNPNFYDLDPKLSRNELHSRIIDRLWLDDGRG